MRFRQVIITCMLALLCIVSVADRADAQQRPLSEIMIPELLIEGGSLQQALDLIIESTGLSHIIPRFGTEQDSVLIGSLVLRNISVADALDLVLTPLNLTYVQQGNFIQIVQAIEERVIPFTWLASRFAMTTQGAGATGGGAAGGVGGAAGATGAAGGAAGGAGMGTNAGAQQFETELKELLSDEAILQIDVQSHTIYVVDYIVNVEALARYIELIDIPPRQIEIEVALVEVIHSDDASAGLDYQFNITGSDMVESAVLDLPGLSQSGFLTDLAGMSLGPVYGGDLSLDVALRALTTLVNAEVESRPYQVVLDGRPANANLTDQIPYTEAVLGQGTTLVTTQFKDVGIILNVTPTILDSTHIQIQLMAEFSSAPSLTAEGVPVVSSRRTTSSVVVGDGEILVVGGLFREEESVTVRGIPILSKIPILKYLFSNRISRMEKRELIILVSPRILPTLGTEIVP